jgi:uncharacterized protein
MQNRTRNLIIGAIAAFFAVLLVGRLAAEFLVDLMWYASLERSDVFWTRWRAGVLFRLIVAVVIGGFVYLNLLVVSRTLGTIRVRRRYANIEIAERLPRIYVVGTLLALSLLSAWWISAGAGDGISALAALRPEPWGVTDPVFRRDLSFYVFQYPLLNRLQTLTAVLVFWTILIAGVAYVATGSARWTDSGPVLTPTARRHLGLLASALLLVFAWDLWLDRYDLLMSGRGVGGALGYTDVNARIPAKQVLALTTGLAAGVGAYSAWHGLLRPPLFALGFVILIFAGGQLVYPSALQKLRVEPDEFAREAPYIEQNLAFTRHAYNLSDLRRERLPYRGGLEPSADALAAAIQGVPLWDSRPLLQTYRALQAPFRPYYDFVSVHYDRYGPPGRAEQVAIAVRELDASRLPEVAQTWQNLHLNYVRAEGAVVSPVSRMTAGGQPSYYVSDLDPVRIAADAPPEVELTEPGVYFAELTHRHVILGAGGASGGGSAPANSPVGVPLDAGWKKLVFAWAFQSRNILLSGELTPESRIVYRRTIRERAAELAPFIHFPPGERAAPYPVIHEGRIVWILDGYTVSTSYPLAPALRFGDRWVRYIRNSVKVTVDGVTGETRLYVIDPDDPLLRTYARIFPTLFQPVSEMPPELRRHLRFPAPLFALQANVLQEYHLRDERAFYNRDDVWQIPTEIYRDRAVPYEPYYAMLSLPGEDLNEFLLKMPFVAAGRQNMTAILFTRNDPPNYGEQILFELPRDELIPGPQQIESLIDQDPAISEQLALWKRGGSDVIRGHIVVLPVDSTLAFVEPLFLEAQESAIPQLERVILASGRRVVMSPTASSAVAALLGPDRVRDQRHAGGLAAAAEPRPDEPPATRVLNGTIVRAQRLLDEAEARLRAGDWAGFGQTWTELRSILRETDEPSP